MDKLAEVIKEQMEAFKKMHPHLHAGMKEDELFDLALDQIEDSLANYKLKDFRRYIEVGALVHPDWYSLQFSDMP